MAGSQDLTGRWTGVYLYESGLGEPVNFLCDLEDEAGALTGEISERVSLFEADEQLSAFVLGQRSGSNVSFAKTYDGAGSFAHRVDYAGQVNETGTIISGYWDIEGEGGTFSMRRPESLARAVEVEEEIGLDLPGTTGGQRP